MNGLPGGMMWAPEALFGGFTVALLWCVTAMIWYAPIVGYLMLASAWAPRGPFLWAVLPPVGLWVLERVVVGSEYIGDFITGRLFGMYRLLGTHDETSVSEIEHANDLSDIGNLDLVGSLREFYASPELWLGVVAAALLLAGAMWVRRYRDETSLKPGIRRSLTMNTILRATAALALLTATLPALAASATATRSWQYKPESNAGLAVRNLMGNVRVERGTAPGFHVTANTTIEAASAGEAERLIKLIEFRTSGRRRGLAIRRAPSAQALSEALLGQGCLDLVSR